MAFVVVYSNDNVFSTWCNQVKSSNGFARWLLSRQDGSRDGDGGGDRCVEGCWGFPYLDSFKALELSKS